MSASVTLGAAQIVAALADAAERWRNADFPPRVRTIQALTARTSYGQPMVEYALDRLFEGVTRDALVAVIESELGSLAALDGFVARRGRPDVYYRGVARAALISSETTIGVALPHLLFGLCAKAGLDVKDREDHFIGSFVETVVEELPELAQLVRVQTWSGSDAAEATRHLAEAELVVAFGTSETLRSIRALLSPEARFEAFGPRTSVGYIARETLASDGVARSCARDAARDALLYDGSGCLSLHALFLERGTAEPASFVRVLSDAIKELAVEFAGPSALTDSLAVAFARRLEFAQSQHGSATVWPAGFAVVIDASPDEPPPLGRRTLALYFVNDPGEALAFLERHRVPLEGFALCPAQRADVADVALRSGAARITRLGRLQAPPITGNHGAKERVLPFVEAIYRDA